MRSWWKGFLGNFPQKEDFTGNWLEQRSCKLIFHPTALLGTFLIDLEGRTDDRGFFSRLFCEREFHEAGLVSRFEQVNDSLTAKRGTLRGFHFQLPPAAEVKVVRCIRGALYDVVVDLRPRSPTYLKWFGANLTSENRTMMYVPRGCAHAFLTLKDDTEVFYLVSDAYRLNLERGIRFNDPTIGVDWPFAPLEISPKDAAWPDIDVSYHGLELFNDLP